MFQLYLPVPLPLQQPFAHCWATWSAHTSLPADRKFPVPGSICAKRQFISHASSWLKHIMVAFALLSLLGTAARRGDDKARTTENLFTLTDARRELHLLQAGQDSSSSCFFISGRVSTRALVPGLIAPGGICSGLQLVTSCPSIKYHLL